MAKFKISVEFELEIKEEDLLSTYDVHPKASNAMAQAIALDVASFKEDLDNLVDALQFKPYSVSWKQIDPPPRRRR